MRDFRIPATYMPPLGGPLNWQDEQSGVLVSAVMAYFYHDEKPMTDNQIQLVLEYLRYYIHAPCWDANPHHDSETRAQLAGVRRRILDMVASPPPDAERAIGRWIGDCLEMGIDPL